MIVQGIPGLEAKLAEIAARLRVAGPKASVSGAEIVARKAQGLAPRDTGALAASIRVEPDALGAAVAADVPYARYVERGTRYMQAEAFLGPALTGAHGEVLAVMAEQFRAALR